MRLLYTRADFDYQNSEKFNTLIMAENDENKSKNPEGDENQGNEEKFQPIETFRELIVGNEQRPSEEQSLGMKELFTSMLVENRKEYDRQVNEMKNLFVGVLEENRKIFQEQLQALYDKLPTMIQETMQPMQQEDFLYVSNEKSNNYQQTERLTRLNAVKELIGGNNFRDLEINLHDTAQSIEKNYTDQRKAILEMSEVVSQKVIELEKDFNEKIKKVAQDLSDIMSQQDTQKAQKNVAAGFFKEIASKIK